MAEEIRQLAVTQKLGETLIVCEALAAYVQSARPLPKGMGKFRSGQNNVSEKARDLIRQAVKDNQWP